MAKPNQTKVSLIFIFQVHTQIEFFFENQITLKLKIPHSKPNKKKTKIFTTVSSDISNISQFRIALFIQIKNRKNKKKTEVEKY